MHTTESLKQLETANQITGEYTDIKNSVYHDINCPGVSRSTLNHMSRSYEHLLEARKNSKRSASLDFGCALHDAVLTPEDFRDNYIVSEKFDRRTKQGKADALAFEEEAKGRIILSENDYLAIAEMKKRLDNHPTVQTLINSQKHEHTYFWRDKKTGLLCKCRPDINHTTKLSDTEEIRMLIDLKTAEDASFNKFRKDIVNYSYDKQAAYYLDGVSAATKLEYKIFVFIVIEKTPPYAIAIYHLIDSVIDVGRNLYKRDLEKYNRGLNSEERSYPLDIQTMDMATFGFDLESRSS